MVRAVRLGYNVLVTDNDVVFFEDPYPFFKSPPFLSFTVINQQESLNQHQVTGVWMGVECGSYMCGVTEKDSMSSLMCCLCCGIRPQANGGFIYVQNARANGPSVWLFVEVSEGRRAALLIAL